MSRRSNQTRVRGPHADGRGGFQYEIVHPSGERERHRCGRGVSEADARAEVDAVRARIEAGPIVVTVGDAVSLYAEHLKRRGCTPKTAQWTERALLELARAEGDRPLGQLRPHHVEAFLDALRDRKLATQRTYFAELTRASGWWHLRGLAARDVVAEALAMRRRRDEPLPWETKAGRRELGRGKTQLRGESDVLRYVEAALADPRPTRRVACVLPVLTGLSAGEVLHLRAGSVALDDGRIYVDDAGLDSWNVKTASRRRWVPIPDVLADDAAALCAGQKPDAWLLRPERERRDRDGEPLTDAWLRQAVARACKAAGVPVVSTHGLRASFASLVTEKAGATVAEVAALLGHSDRGRTAARHYVGAVAARPSLRVVRPGKVDA